MKHFSNILVVMNGDLSRDNQALTEGVDLAIKCDARLTIMGVVAPPNRMIPDFTGLFASGELLNKLVEQCEAELNQIAEDLSGTLDIHVHVAKGKDFIEIVRQVVHGDHDLLIKTVNPTKHDFDSCDLHIMRKCPVPVWLQKPARKGKIHRVLATIDLDLEAEEEGQQLNALIMDFATSLAKWEQARLHLLSCWSLYGEQSLRDSAFMKVSRAELDVMLDHEATRHAVVMDNLVKRYPQTLIETHLIKGEPAEHITAFANEQEIDTVVMGTVARSGIPGLLIGNTAEAILHRLDCSVITVKPSGFESIIQ